MYLWVDAQYLELKAESSFGQFKLQAREGLVMPVHSNSSSITPLPCMLSRLLFI